MNEQQLKYQISNYQITRDHLKGHTEKNEEVTKNFHFTSSFPFLFPLPKSICGVWGAVRYPSKVWGGTNPKLNLLHFNLVNLVFH